MIKHPTEDVVKQAFNETYFAQWERVATISLKRVQNHGVDDQLFRTIGVQLQALGLVKIEYSKTIAGGMALFWSLTRSGERLMVETRTVRTKITNTNAVKDATDVSQSPLSST